MEGVLTVMKRNSKHDEDGGQEIYTEHLGTRPMEIWGSLRSGHCLTLPRVTLAAAENGTRPRRAMTHRLSHTGVTVRTRLYPSRLPVT